jgi:hypothetical protein
MVLFLARPRVSARAYGSRIKAHATMEVAKDPQSSPKQAWRARTSRNEFAPRRAPRNSIAPGARDTVAAV